MKTVQFAFKGMMVPVFTPFNDDKQRTLNIDIIDKYVQYLSKNGMHGILVNGMSGEGMTLRVDERKLVAEEWMKAARKYQMPMMLNIGGADIADVYDMAQHAEKLGVDAVLILPDFFYHPHTEEDMVQYMQDVAQYCPSRPMMYYHVPMMINMHMQMFRFVEMAEKEVPTFAGVMFADSNLDKAMSVMKPGTRTIIMGMGTCMLGAMSQGLEAVSMTAMNLFPEMMKEMYDLMQNNRMREAMMVQQKMTQRIYSIWTPGSDMIMTMKSEYNKLNADMKMGPMRKPKMMTMPMNRM